MNLFLSLKIELTIRYIISVISNSSYDLGPFSSSNQSLNNAKETLLSLCLFSISESMFTLFHYDSFHGVLSFPNSDYAAIAWSHTTQTIASAYFELRELDPTLPCPISLPLPWPPTTSSP